MTQHPPKLFTLFLQCLTQDDYQESLTGDFTEVYHFTAEQRGKAPAILSYGSQIIKLMVITIMKSTVWSVIMFRNYLKIAFRNLKKHVGYSVINITGLAVGMACCILFFLWVRDELSYDRFHEHTDRLYRIVSERDGSWTGSSPFSLGRVMKQDFPEIERNSRFLRRQGLIKYQDKMFYEQGALVDEDFLPMFSFRMIDGNPSTALQTLESMVITQSMALKYFGTENPVGQIVTLNNSSQHTVTGVVEDPPPNSTMQFDLLVNFRIAGDRMDQSWWLGSDSYVLLRENVDLEDLRQKIAGTELKYDTRIESKEAINDLQHITRMHLFGLNSMGSILYVYLFSFIAVIVLLIACINFINLTTARASNRAREVGLRKTVGANRSSIIRQFFGETVLLSCIAFILAILIVIFLLPHFNSLSGKQLIFNPTGNFTMLFGLLAIAAFTGLVSGIYPALFLSSFKPIVVLRESLSAGAKNPLLRRILVVFQFTVATILIIGSMTIQRQMGFIRKKDLGFTRENIVRLPINDQIRANYQAFKDALLQDITVVNVTASRNSPTRVGNINPFYWEGRGPDQYETLNFATVDYDYFETFGMTMAAGRTFSKEYSTDGANYIVNEALIRHTKLDPPLDRMLSMWTREGRIIGVVKDFHARSLHSAIGPIAFLLTTDWPHNWIFARLDPSHIQEGLQHIETVWKEYSSGFPFVYEFLDDVFESQYSGDARIGDILKNFTVLAIFISCLGLFGLASFMAEQRTKEIGIRKVMGASVARIYLLMSKEFFLLLGIAYGVAWPISYFIMRQLLNGYAYKTSLAWWIFVGAGILTTVVSLITVSFQVMKAASTNPVDAIKYE